MTRTKLRQLEQVVSSETYDDFLNQNGSAGTSIEGQPGGAVGAALDVVSITASTKTIIVVGDVVGLGINSSDELAISSSGNGNDGSYTVASLSYSSPNTTIVVQEIIPSNEATISSGVTFVVDPDKNVERDLNHIRTQLRKLNKSSEWYELGDVLLASAHSSQTSVSISEGSEIDAGFNFDAGEPYDLVVYLNGEQLIPSAIAGTSVTTERDYQELDSSGENVSTGFTGRKIAINFDIISGDILQFNLSR